MAHKLAHRIKSGTVWVNCHNVFDAAMPFGGYKQSGWGREMGHEALNSYTETKAVTGSLAGQTSSTGRSGPVEKAREKLVTPLC